jgi:hypothetical protein
MRKSKNKGRKDHTVREGSKGIKTILRKEER